MNVIVYGDFNCPYSYLASQRADRLVRARVAQVSWRAVEHDPGLAVTGTSAAADSAGWERELAEVAALALPGEHVPSAPPPVISNTGPAIAAYAEAVSDGIADELRRRLFTAIWADRMHLTVFAVRGAVTGLMWRPESAARRLASPDLPDLLDHDPDLGRIVRRSGGTLAPDGGPVSTAAWQRIRRWRTEWLALPSQVIPAVAGPGEIVRSGVDALRYLADLAATTNAPPRSPADAGPEQGRGHQPVLAARTA